MPYSKILSLSLSFFYLKCCTTELACGTGRRPGPHRAGRWYRGEGLGPQSRLWTASWPGGHRWMCAQNLERREGRNRGVAAILEGSFLTKKLCSNDCWSATCKVASRGELRTGMSKPTHTDRNLEDPPGRVPTGEADGQSGRPSDVAAGPAPCPPALRTRGSGRPASLLFPHAQKALPWSAG